MPSHFDPRRTTYCFVPAAPTSTASAFRPRSCFDLAGGDNFNDAHLLDFHCSTGCIHYQPAVVARDSGSRWLGRFLNIDRGTRWILPPPIAARRDDPLAQPQSHGTSPGTLRTS